LEIKDVIVVAIFFIEPLCSVKLYNQTADQIMHKTNKEREIPFKKLNAVISEVDPKNIKDIMMLEISPAAPARCPLHLSVVIVMIKIRIGITEDIFAIRLNCSKFPKRISYIFLIIRFYLR
jgi:hypothetical protein